MLLTLNTFSATGGIEKVCRAAGKALYEVATEHQDDALIFSIYDEQKEVDEKYFPVSIFKGFGGKKLPFIWQSLLYGRKSRSVILSHINLLPVGFLIKLVYPKTKLILIAHGIEVWGAFPLFKKKMLNFVDLFLPVSEFTALKLQSIQNIGSDKISVINNCLDPFLRKESDKKKEEALRRKYGYTRDNLVLLTLARLKFSEQYKGYDKVLQTIRNIKEQFPLIKYLIVGRYDDQEKARLEKIIEEEGIKDAVSFAGFVDEEELSSHFNISDLYIMPSVGEGFGIVFIEALFHGKPVIAGNQDGSVDALGRGAFGVLVNPNKGEEIEKAICDVLKNTSQYRPDEEKLISFFGFKTYVNNWRKVLYSDRVPFIKTNSHNTVVNNTI